MMARQFLLGVIGADERTAALGLRLGASSPFKEGPVKLHCWAAGSGGLGHAMSEARTGGGAAIQDEACEQVRAQARAAGVTFLSDWRAMLQDSQVDAVFVGGPYAGRAEVVREALVAGKAVMCPLPMALTPEELESIAKVSEGRVLITPTDLSYTIAGKKLLAEVMSGNLGQLHSIFCALRERAGPASGVFEDLGWEVVDFILQCARAPLVRAQAFAGRLFAPGAGPAAGGAGSQAGDPEDDAVVFMLRFEGNVIASGEVARSLTADSPSPREADIDVAGTTSAVRAEPYKYTTNVWRQDPHAWSQHLWHTHPMTEMLEELWKALADGRTEQGVIERSRQLIAVMDEVRRSMARGVPLQ